LVATLACAQGAGAAGLPTVSSGERPGPPLLYAPPPTAPELSVQAPFAAKPLLVSGTDAVRNGEYLYQDYLFDDHGANTAGGLGSQPPGTSTFSPSAGDVTYPTAARFANNAADIVELRVTRTTDAVVYRVTLGAVLDDDTTVVGIGINTDAAGATQVEWPRGAGISSPGLEHFVTAWGTGGQVSDLSGEPATTGLPAGAVTIDQATNQMTIRVPRATMEPGASTWRLVAGAGLFTGDTTAAGDAWKDAQRGSPTEDTPGSGSQLREAPGVMNLAFRFDEPQGMAPGRSFDTVPGPGNFYEEKQAVALAGETSGDFHADVNFAELASGATKDLHAPGAQQARIFASGQSLPEGVRDEFPQFGGRLQPYAIRVPPGLDRSKPAGLTFSLHSLEGTYTQYAVFSPTQLTQFGDERQNLVVTTLGRGPDGWYTGEAEADFFEVWRDVAANFSLDPDRVYPTGYSMGGYGTYKLGLQYPDLFARAFTTVGPPGLGIWPVVAPPLPGGQVTLTTPLLGNVRWIPYMNWVGLEDDLVPYPGPTAQQNRFDQLGLRSELWTFQAEHFTLAIQDRWNAARDFLGAARKQGDPSRVVYGFFPEGDKPELGLVPLGEEAVDHAAGITLLARGAEKVPGRVPPILDREGEVLRLEGPQLAAQPELVESVLLGCRPGVGHQVVLEADPVHVRDPAHVAQQRGGEGYLSARQRRRHHRPDTQTGRPDRCERSREQVRVLQSELVGAVPAHRVAGGIDAVGVQREVCGHVAPDLEEICLGLARVPAVGTAAERRHHQVLALVPELRQLGGREHRVLGVGALERVQGEGEARGLAAIQSWRNANCVWLKPAAELRELVPDALRKRLPGGEDPRLLGARGVQILGRARCQLREVHIGMEVAGGLAGQCHSLLLLVEVPGTGNCVEAAPGGHALRFVEAEREVHHAGRFAKLGSRAGCVLGWRAALRVLPGVARSRGVTCEQTRAGHQPPGARARLHRGAWHSDRHLVGGLVDCHRARGQARGGWLARQVADLAAGAPGRHEVLQPRRRDARTPGPFDLRRARRVGVDPDAHNCGVVVEHRTEGHPVDHGVRRARHSQFHDVRRVVGEASRRGIGHVAGARGEGARTRRLGAQAPGRVRAVVVEEVVLVQVLAVSHRVGAGDEQRLGREGRLHRELRRGGRRGVEQRRSRPFARADRGQPGGACPLCTRERRHQRRASPRDPPPHAQQPTARARPAPQED